MQEQLTILGGEKWLILLTWSKVAAGAQGRGGGVQKNKSGFQEATIDSPRLTTCPVDTQAPVLSRFPHHLAFLWGKT